MPLADPATRVHDAVRQLAGGPVVLAVSGGLDSMTLLEAAARVLAPGAGLVVATFDHGTGAAATRATGHVAARARRLGLPVARGRARAGLRGEAGWREARWAFLRDVARRHAAVVATAHTGDDQVETVFMRILRGAGARGLAALAASSDVRRPFLGLSRADLRAYAVAHAVRWLDDPTNASRAFLRNRVRHELLPAVRRVRPAIDAELLAIGARAAAWRLDVERLVDALVPRVTARPSPALDVVSAPLGNYSLEALAILWPAIAARAGVTVDRRGTRRLAAFTIDAGVGDRMQLSGGWEVVRQRERFALRRAAVGVPAWRLRHVDEASAAAGLWGATLPTGRRLDVRAWQPGDRMRAAGAHAARRVKRFLADARVAGPDRAGWPVVLADDEIVWIPGIRRSDAATERSGRPGVSYVCERNDG